MIQHQDDPHEPYVDRRREESWWTGPAVALLGCMRYGIPVGFWLTSFLTCLEQGAFLLLGGVVLFPPLGILHGLYVVVDGALT